MPDHPATNAIDDRPDSVRRRMIWNFSVDIVAEGAGQSYR